MAITVFPDVLLPNRVISAGVRGRQIRQNERVAQVSGFARVNLGWEQTLREFEIGVAPMRREAWLDIETIHEITEGGAYGFLLEDPKDSTVTTTATAWGMVEGLGSNTFQLHRRLKHVLSGRFNDRKITRPLASAFKLYISGVESASYTLDDETGIVTIPANPAVDTVIWTGRFYVPVHFMSDSIDWDMVVSGPDPDARFLSGPSVILQEIRE